MSVWLELHCDALRDGSTIYGECSCYAKSGSSPGIMWSSKGVSYGVAELMRQARAKGYRFTRETGWVCPACQVVSATSSPPATPDARQGDKS